VQAISRHATLKFHQASLFREQLSDKAVEYSTKKMLASYNPKLRAFLKSHHYMDTPEFHSISGDRLVKEFGYKACD
jgi:hypothetical protein